ncbi:MAG: 16S rRNA (adenine(1518)-N(6)/adenine(1519)-N(6))-dimethyltransferase RsmA [bacterium]|nr:16S rRNA (adenine(1518)-N(6)/adenine(1519)-N(6))-dimethyltransferase RsmA [bacterium]
MTNPKMLLDQFAIAPKKSLGQNFIHDPNVLEKIVTIAEILPGDTVLEIGPGTGALTEHLAPLAGRVIAVEIDGRLESILRGRFARWPNIEFVFGDILETDLRALVPESYIVVANLPYYITSAILRHLLETDRRAKRLILTVQLEVAERLTAKPDDMSLLSVSVQYYAKAKIAARINKAVFYPRPDVDSAVVRLDAYEKPPVDVPGDAQFFRIVRAGFAQKRKQLKNTLGDLLLAGKDDPIGHDFAGMVITEAGIDPRRRAETLTLEEWAALTRAFVQAGLK